MEMVGTCVRRERARVEHLEVVEHSSLWGGSVSCGLHANGSEMVGYLRVLSKTYNENRAEAIIVFWATYYGILLGCTGTRGQKVAESTGVMAVEDATVDIGGTMKTD